VGGTSSAGTKLKSTSGWFGGGNGEDEFGFSVLPAGYYHSNYDGFFSVGNGAYFWSSTEYNSGSAYYVYFYYYYYEYVYLSRYDKNCGLSVRCLRDSN